MSHKYRFDINTYDLPERRALKVGCEEIIFEDGDIAKEIADLINEHAIGHYNYEPINAPDGTQQYTNIIDENRTVYTEEKNCGTIGEVLQHGEFLKVTKCDGVPRADGGNCGCWNEYEGHIEEPKGWQSYFDGLAREERHICSGCQNKNIQVRYEKVVECVLSDDD
jgi:hypothetical protein